MKIQLGKFVTIEKFKSCKYLQYRSYGLYLPTERVVYRPEIVTPKIARVFETHLWLYKDAILSYKQLRKRAGKEFHGTYGYSEILLWEVWFDEGDDGHTDFRHAGYLFESSKAQQIPENLEYPAGWIDSFCWSQKW